jgi:hypothetical protein
MRISALLSHRKRVTNLIPANRTLNLACQVAALSFAFAGSILAQGLTITTSSLPQGVVGANYQAGFAVTGGTAPYRWAANGSVPPGLEVFPSGSIFGVPFMAGSFSFNVVVTDANNLSTSKPFTIVVTGSVVSITTTSPLPSGSVGQAYSQTLLASNGTPPYQWTAGSGVPTGLTLNPSTGAITGTPTTAGNYSFQVSVTDSASNTASATFALTINAPTILPSPQYRRSSTARSASPTVKRSPLPAESRPINGLSPPAAPAGSLSIQIPACFRGLPKPRGPLCLPQRSPIVQATPPPSSSR